MIHDNRMLILNFRPIRSVYKIVSAAFAPLFWYRYCYALRLEMSGYLLMNLLDTFSLQEPPELGVSVVWQLKLHRALTKSSAARKHLGIR